MPLGRPSIIGGVTGGLTHGAASAFAPAIDRSSLTGAYLTRPTASGPSMPAVGTCVFVGIPNAIDTASGTIIRAIKGSQPRISGFALRLETNVIRGFVVDGATTIINVAHTATGFHNSGTLSMCWLRWGDTANTLEVGANGSGSPTTGTNGTAISTGKPTDVTDWELLSSPSTAATHDLQATAQVGVWARALSDAEIDAINSSLDLRTADPTSRILWPEPLVGVGVEITADGHVTDAADGFAWEIQGSGDLTGAALS